jgi:hypothetical protein
MPFGMGMSPPTGAFSERIHILYGLGGSLMTVVVQPTTAV